MHTPVSSFAFVRLLVLPLAALALAGCGTAERMPGLQRATSWLAPYKPDIVQGNVVTTEQIAQVKVGMPRAQVRDILGSPLIADAFHAQRWDYVFTMRRQGLPSLRRALVVEFDADNVKSISAPELPSELEFVADISTEPLPRKTPKLELTPAERDALPAPKAVAAAASASETPVGASRTYPPLEAP